MEEEKSGEAQPRPEPVQKQETKTVSDVLQSVQIALDGYDDIFSDFDPSPYEKRILSEDFLFELRRRHFETKKGQFSINFTMPKTLRSDKTESLIKKRIKDYFRSRMKDTEKQANDKMKRGIMRFGAGALLSLLILTIPLLDSVPVVTILSVFIWYLLWSGYEHLFEVSMRTRKKQQFYERFLKADYIFMDQEELVRSISTSSSYR